MMPTKTLIFSLAALTTVCAASSNLRASHFRRLLVNTTAATTSTNEINLCFCEGCDLTASNADAGGHTCKERVQWVMGKKENYTEIDACRRVAQDEYPDDCGECDPDVCQVQNFCGVPTCTVDVLETPACNDELGGCHPCGERIRYLVESKKYSTIDACHRVAFEQFPGECGSCFASQPQESWTASPAPTFRPTDGPTTGPSSLPSSSPTQVPTPGPTSLFLYEHRSGPTSDNNIFSVNPCGTATCTQEVLDTMACNNKLGGCHSCESRINYLINEKFYASNDACEIVAYDQFMAECGGCIPDHLRTPVIPVDPSKLIWSDEFDYNGAPDPSKWSFDIGTGSNGWGNSELQYYTDRLDNAFVQDGMLTIRAVRESYGGKDYTSARITTKSHGDWTYGRVQIRARLSNGSGRGTWSAAWMLPTDGVYGGWPESGEIDIMEHVGYGSGVFHGTVHTDTYNHMKGTQRGGDVPADLDGWHVFEIDWSADKIDFIVDDFRFYSFSKDEPNTFREWPFDQRMHVILNMAVGGSWGGVEGVDEAAFEGVGQVMEVDWVRVYSAE